MLFVFFLNPDVRKAKQLGIAPNKVSVFALSAVVELSEFTHLFTQSSTGSFQLLAFVKVAVIPLCLKLL